jgi:catechol 2,3-dioxygenase-like lactoylglutathione lyase family enzyme
MTARPHNITFDCADPYAQVKFWSQVTGYREDPENPNQPGDPEGYLAGPDGQARAAVRPRAEPKTVKNRRRSDGTGWVVLADPEGNELGIERSAAERAGGG